GDFPFYGTLVTEPQHAARTFKEEGKALVDQTLMTQFGISTGDSVKVGNATLEIAGSIIEVPGEAAAVSMVGPRIFIPHSLLDSTRLIQPGSRVEYKRYFKFEESRDMAHLEEHLD